MSEENVETLRRGIDAAALFTFEGRRVTRLALFTDRAEVLKAAGLRSRRRTTSRRAVASAIGEIEAHAARPYLLGENRRPTTLAPDFRGRPYRVAAGNPSSKEIEMEFVIGGIIYFFLLVTVGIISIRKGHWVMFHHRDLHSAVLDHRRTDAAETAHIGACRSPKAAGVGDVAGERRACLSSGRRTANSISGLSHSVSRPRAWERSRRTAHPRTSMEIP